MRARLARPALALAAVATAVLATSASAAPNTLTLTDTKGDANAINGQGLQPGLGDNAGPVQKSDSDIVSVTLASTGVTKKVKGKSSFTCTGFTAVMELAAPAGSASVYRVLGGGVVNASQFWLQYSNSPTGITTTIRHNDGAAKTTPLATPAKLDGNKILFTVTEKDLKAAGEKLATFKMSGLGADARTSNGAATVPSWDNIDEDETKSFSPCK
jgi:hypothetical protein